ncbi:MAG: single-stranded DNA-binding protein [Bacteriovoracaceae bacterium]|nr:single-stranded DNA-binding protein [Bacteriovoracaceae bacterium]
MSVNKVILLGRLGQDPEMKHTPSGTAVCNFSMATSESWADKTGQRQERTEWHRIVVWGKLAELCNQYLAKGRQAFVEGRLQTRSWDGKDGSKRYTTEVVATTVQFIGAQGQANQSQGQSQNYGGGQQQQQQQNNNQQGQSNQRDEEFSISAEASFTSDDIPF